tara:strand:+ start:34 stop:207 length:174 start_codon:yes stop_codon:yes gene_type:complete
VLGRCKRLGEKMEKRAKLTVQYCRLCDFELLKSDVLNIHDKCLDLSNDEQQLKEGNK